MIAALVAFIYEDMLHEGANFRELASRGLMRKGVTEDQVFFLQSGMRGICHSMYPYLYLPLSFNVVFSPDRKGSVAESCISRHSVSRMMDDHDGLYALEFT